LDTFPGERVVMHFAKKAAGRKKECRGRGKSTTKPHSGQLKKRRTSPKEKQTRTKNGGKQNDILKTVEGKVIKGKKKKKKGGGKKNPTNQKTSDLKRLTKKETTE